MGSGDWIDRVDSVVGWVVVIGGFLVAVRARLVALVRAVRAGNDLVDTFGDRPGRKIESALRRVQVSDAVQQVRQASVEAFNGLGVFNCDSSGAVTWCNAELAELFGIDAGRMRGMGWTAAIAESDRARVVTLWRQTVELGLPFNTQYKIENQRTGESVNVRSTVRTVEIVDNDDPGGADGVLLFYVGTVTATNRPPSVD